MTAGTGGVTPVPDRVALSGLVDALVRKVRDADRAPSAVGTNVTLTVQLLPAARLVPQGLFEIAKSPAFAPVKVMLVIVTAAGPVFVNVTVLALLVTPNPVLGKVKLVGLRLTENGVSPVPDSGTLFGLVGALVVNTNDAALPPVAEGVKVRLTMQLAPAARLAPQGLFEMEKSAAFAPVKAMLEMVSVAEPVLVNVTVCGLVVTPTMTFPKDKLAGVRTTVGAGVPLPA